MQEHDGNETGIRGDLTAVLPQSEKALLELAERCEQATAGEALGIGTKVKFDSERCRYTVMAANERFVILTKPFNAKRTYLYTIADLERGWRGACNLIFGLPCDVNTPVGAAEALAMIERGEMGVSYRNCVQLSPSEAAALRAHASTTSATGRVG